MTVQELMTKSALRNRLSDSIESGYDDDELIAYFNDAINFSIGAILRVLNLGIICIYYK